MKKYYLSLLLLAITLPMVGQEVTPERVMPKDSLPDLWVLTIDLTGSMKDGGRYSAIPNKVNALLEKNCKDIDHASFLLLSSGMLMNDLRSSSTDFARTYGLNYRQVDFASLLIRDMSQLTNYSNAKMKLKNVCDYASNFKYERSFASLARPLSMYYLTNKKNLDFSPYRNIYHVAVTDDGETNDQWSLEYNFLNLHYPHHFADVNQILPKIACSNFDFISSKSGKFKEVDRSSVQPYVYITQYITYQDEHPDQTLPVASLVGASNFHDHCFTLRMKPCSDSINFVYVKSCLVNDSAVTVNQYLYPGDSLVVEYDKAWAKTYRNHIGVLGSYQEVYNDRILGLRYRTVDIVGDLDESFVSVETKAKEYLYIKELVALLLAVLAFIIIWRNLVVLRIYVHGKVLKVKRKAMKKLKHDDYNLLTVVVNPKGIDHTLFYKGCGIFVEDDNETMENDRRFVIKSHRRLNPDSRDIAYELYDNGHTSDAEFRHEVSDSTMKFQYASRLSHILIVRIATKQMEQKSGNTLRQRNLQMLASYYEDYAQQIQTVRNNVLVNIIERDYLDSNYKYDYAVLNIFDLNSQHASDHIFLKYSMMCFFDKTQKSAEEITEQMLEVARFVLKKEGEKAGHFDTTPNTIKGRTLSSVTVDVSPMLSYLYLLKKGKQRLVYSPFTDGRLGLKVKEVKIFPKANMALLNLPVKHAHPEYRQDSPSKVLLGKCVRKTEVIAFLDEDIIRFMGEEKDFGCGNIGACHAGITFQSWNIENILSFIAMK